MHCPDPSDERKNQKHDLKLLDSSADRANQTENPKYNILQKKKKNKKSLNADKNIIFTKSDN